MADIVRPSVELISATAAEVLGKRRSYSPHTVDGGSRRNRVEVRVVGQGIPGVSPTWLEQRLEECR